MFPQPLYQALEKNLQRKFEAPSLRLLSVDFKQDVQNLNDRAVGKEFIANKFSAEAVSLVGFHALDVTYDIDGVETQLSLVMKGHEPGAFVDNICPPTLEASGISLSMPFKETYLYHEFEWLFEGEYHYYPLQQNYPNALSVLPGYYGRYYDRESNKNYIFIELLDQMEHVNEWLLANDWPLELHAAAVDGLAKVHASYYGKEQDADLQEPWLAGHLDAALFERSNELWRKIFDTMTALYPEVMNEEANVVFSEVLQNVSTWYGAVADHPKTIVHGDFNPRNIGFIREADQWRLIALDWECIRWGLPQYDLAQYLLHSFSPDKLLQHVDIYVEQMRVAMERYTQVPIDPAMWQLGFEAAVKLHLLNRAPMIGLVCHVFMPGIENFGLHMFKNAVALLRHSKFAL